MPCQPAPDCQLGDNLRSSHGRREMARPLGHRPLVQPSACSVYSVALLADAAAAQLTAGQCLFKRGDPPCGLYAVLEGACASAR